MVKKTRRYAAQLAADSSGSRICPRQRQSYIAAGGGSGPGRAAVVLHAFRAAASQPRPRWSRSVWRSAIVVVVGFVVRAADPAPDERDERAEASDRAPREAVSGAGRLETGAPQRPGRPLALRGATRRAAGGARARLRRARHGRRGPDRRPHRHRRVSRRLRARRAVRRLATLRPAPRGVARLAHAAPATSSGCSVPNGAGKSTLIGMLATLVAPTSGTVRYGEPTSPPTAGPAIRARIGLLAHELHLYPELTARQNLEFFARLHGLDPGDVVPRRSRPPGLSDRADDHGRRVLARHAAAAGARAGAAASARGSSCSTSRSPGSTTAPSAAWRARLRAGGAAAPSSSSRRTISTSPTAWSAGVGG